MIELFILCYFTLSTALKRKIPILKMELQKQLLPIFRIYQSSGFAPFTIPLDHANQKVKWFIFNGLLTAWLAALVVHDIISYKRFFEDEKSMMISYLSFMIITVMRVVALAIAIESFLERNQQIAFLNQFDRINRLFTNDLGVIIDYKKIRRKAYISMTLWMLQLTTLTVLILMDIIFEDVGIWTKIWWFSNTFPLFLPSTRYFQIIHYMQLLGICFDIINTRLDEFQCHNKNYYGSIDYNRLNVIGTRKSNAEQMYNDIVTMRRIYHHLWENTEQLNKMFRWSLLLLIGASFFIIVVNFYRTLYWILTPDPSNLDTIITYFIWSIVHMFHFINLSSICYNISQQVGNFAEEF